MRQQDGMEVGGGKVCVIGLDAATFDLIRPMIAEGKLPHLRNLMERGASGPLASTVPCLSPNAWSSFVTGQNAGRHGIYSFTRQKPGSYEVEFINARARRTSPLWSLLSQAGRRVGVINIPVSYPPEPVNGFLISGMDAPSTEADFTYPPELKAEIREVVGEYQIEYSLIGAVDPHSIPRTLQEVQRMEEVRARLARHLMRTREWDFFCVVFVALDRLQHFFWHAMDPTHPRYHEPGAEHARTAIPDMYEVLDRVVGDLLTELDEDTTVVILSDHGAGPFDDAVPYLNLNNWLAQEGWLGVKESRASWFQRSARGLRAVLRKHLSAGLKSWLKHRFGKARERFQSYLFFSHIDWSLTRAYASYDEIMARGIRLNVRGREPEGTVEPGEEYEQVRERLMADLQQLTHPVTGEPVVEQVFRREELYAGPCLEEAPDLIVEWSEGALFSGCQTAEPQEEVFPLTHLPRSGEHRREGILIMAGPSIQPGAAITNAHIMDLAPTLLYLLGESVPQDMDGQLLTQSLRPEVLAHQPVVQRAPGEVEERTPEGTYDQEEEELIRQRLSDLGYLE